MARRLSFLSHALLAASLLGAVAVPTPSVYAQAPIQADGLELKIRRLPDSIELLIEGAGEGGALEQQRSGNTWTGELRTNRARGLKVGPQSLSMRDAGMERITFDGTGRLFQLTVSPVAGQIVASPVVSSDGRDLIIRFPAPPSFVQQNARLNLSQPAAVPRPNFVPPLRPRAIAPPLGDMAVGSMMLANRSYIKLSGPPVTLTTRSAQARDVLMVLAQMGGYGFAYSDLPPSNSNPPLSNSSSGGAITESKYATPPIAPVTVSFRAEPFDRAFNFVLLSAGLQARKEGNTILVGPSVLSKNVGAQMSKVYRLNQVSPESAADYLANLGAQVRKTYVSTTSVSQGTPSGDQVSGTPASQTTQTQSSTEVDEYGAGTGPLLGLSATTDSRLGTITVVGEPALVSIAEHYLRQLDLRQRQVALSVKILDVSLNNDSEIDNSFALRFGNNFIVNDGGQMLAAFGRYLPANNTDFLNSRESLSSSQSSSSGSSAGSSSGSGGSKSASINQQLTLDLANERSLTQSQIEELNLSLERETGTKIEPFERVEVTTDQNGNIVELPPETIYKVVPIGSSTRRLTDSLQRTIQEVISSRLGSSVGISRSNSSSREQSFSVSRSGSSSQQSSQDSFYSSARRRNPGLNYPDQEFFNFLRAQIVSSNTKILASPTLILQEGREAYDGSDSARISSDGKVGRSKTNEAYVRVGTQLVTSYEIKQDINGNNFCQPVFGNAGLTFGARVDKIDDNGFVTFSLSPEISAAVGSQSAGNCGNINIINDRLLDTGKLRVRDGQTLILTGVISDLDRQEVSKWPILGDLPLIGQFFRKTSGSRSKNELVIMVTPRIVNDSEGGTYGYGYTPSTNDAKQLLYGASSQ